MGEATYYLRARFPSSSLAAAAEPALRAALVRLAALNDRWQSIRSERERSCADRRRELQSEFPDLEGMVPWGAIADECASYGSDASMNCCAGSLPDMTDEFELAAVDDEVRLSGVVWHFASWDGIANWVRQNGAVAAGWGSDEYMDPWDSVGLE